jgi:hypothetical protein
MKEHPKHVGLSATSVKIFESICLGRTSGKSFRSGTPLIEESVAATCNTPEELAIECMVSMQAATIEFQRVKEDRNRATTAQRIAQAATEFRESVQSRRIDHPRVCGELCTS